MVKRIDFSDNIWYILSLDLKTLDGGGKAIVSGVFSAINTTYYGVIYPLGTGV